MNNEKISLLETKFSHGRAIDEQLEFLKEQLGENKNISVFLEESKKSDEGIISIGRGVFMKAKLEGDSFYVNVGAGVFLKKSFEDTNKIVEEQISKLRELTYRLTQEAQKNNAEMQKLIEEIEQK